MSFLEVFVSSAYRISKEHLIICNGVTTLEDFFLSRLLTVSLVTLSSWRPDAEQLRAARCSVQCPASALIPPPEHFGSQNPQPIGWVCRLLYWLNKHGVSGFFFFFFEVCGGVFSLVLHQSDKEQKVESSLSTEPNWHSRNIKELPVRARVNGPNTHTQCASSTETPFETHRFSLAFKQNSVLNYSYSCVNILSFLASPHLLSFLSNLLHCYILRVLCLYVFSFYFMCPIY